MVLGTTNLPTQLASQRHLKGPFLLFSDTFPQLQSPLGEMQREGNGLGSLLPPRVPQTLAQRPWLQASKWGEGEEWLPGHIVTFRGPQRRAPGPSPSRTAPPGLEGCMKFLSPFLIGAQGAWRA